MKLNQLKIINKSSINVKNIVLFSGIIILLLLIILVREKNSPRPVDLPSLAQQIVKSCKNEKYPQYCYERLIPTFMDPPTSLTMQQGFELTGEVQKLDKNYAYCHVTGHYLSEKEVRKNPNNWKEVITKCPFSGCANGCIHGALMEHFKNERFNDQQLTSLAGELQTICTKNDYWSPSAMETVGCFHALGHTAMYLTDANIDRSINFCNKVGYRKNTFSYYYNCYQGVFMQIFQPLRDDDQMLVQKLAPKTGDGAASFCSSYKGLLNTACLNQIYPLFLDRFKNPDRIADYCHYYPAQSKNYCYSTVVNLITEIFSLDTVRISDYCTRQKDFDAAKCLGMSAERMVQINLDNLGKAVDLCRKNTNLDPEGFCYQSIIKSSQGTLRNYNKEKYTFCNQLPEDWQQKCLKNS